jgi:oligoendopeptidase F
MGFVTNELGATSWKELEPLYKDLASRSLDDVEQLEMMIRDESELREWVSEVGSRLYVSMTCSTDDEEKKMAYLDFVENVEPKLSEIADQLNRQIMDSPALNELDSETYGVMIRDIQADIEIFREENIPLQTELTKLGQQYEEICGSMMVVFDGEERTIQQMGKFLQVTDRETRERAWKAVSERRLEDANKIDDLYEQMLTIRHQISLNAGFENYRDYAFVAKHRFDYTPKDCENFHLAAEEVCVPLGRILDQQRKNLLGVAKLRPWDLGVDVYGRPPLKPFENVDEMVEGTSRMFHKVSDELGIMFDSLKDGKSLDLDSRKGKAPGGYQISFDKIRRPFIFMNATGLQRDLETMVHEAGHAFHAMYSSDLDLIDHRYPPIEYAEVAAMSMELIVHPHLEEFYTKTDADRARRNHLEGVVGLLPWIATIDAFQHWVHTNPGHSRDERTTVWRDLRNRFGANVEWDGLEDMRDFGWHRQLHLFTYPFYYIEYGIAQLGALQIWLQSLNSVEAALENYAESMKLGGSKPLPELFAAAKLEFSFDPITVQRLIDAVQLKLSELPA